MTISTLFLWLTMILGFLPFSQSCLPTQHADDGYVINNGVTTITTTTTTTTTTTEARYPCSVCRKIYGAGCLGSGNEDICATVAEVGLKYTLGILTGYNYGDSNTCSTIFSCPIGTTSKIRELLTGLIIDGPALVIATCSEVGDDAGTWYLGIPPLVTPIEIVSTTCENII